MKVLSRKQINGWERIEGGEAAFQWKVWKVFEEIIFKLKYEGWGKFKWNWGQEHARQDKFWQAVDSEPGFLRVDSTKSAGFSPKFYLSLNLLFVFSFLSLPCSFCCSSFHLSQQLLFSASFLPFPLHSGLWISQARTIHIDE